MLRGERIREKMKKKIIIAGICIIALCAVIVPKFTKPKQFAQAVALPVMDAEKPETGDIRLTTSVIGKIEPSDVVYIYPKAAGDVTEVNVKAGDIVTKGQVLCNIDTKQVESAKNTMDSAALTLRQAQEELSRQQLLYAGGGLSDQQYSQYQNAVSSAQINYDQAKYNYETQLEYSQITAPIGLNSRDQSRNEEFASLFKALAIAVFLIFVVMAAQFESIKFSGMVMTTIPFSLIGAFGLLWLTDCSISMVSLIGFLMLIGTVVNNGILFVDTANQYRGTMNRDTALIEAGATRIRPILMTTLTTVVSMIPMAFSGTTTKSLAIVDIGGLTASTILCLLMLPVYYRLMSGREKPGDLEAPAKKRKRTRENIMNKIKGLFAGFSKKGNKKDDQ